MTTLHATEHAEQRAQPTDEALIAYIGARPGVSLARLCAAFDLPVRAADGAAYSAEARALRAQLQRLRRRQVLWGVAQRWTVRKEAR